MSATFRNGLRAGLVFSVVTIFLVLIAFNVTAAGMISKPLIKQGLPEARSNILCMAIIMGFMGLWAGYYSFKPAPGHNTWFGALVAGFGAGAVMGFTMAILVYILGVINTKGINLRTYMAALSPDVIQRVLFGLSPQKGSLAYLGLYIATGILGGLLAFGISRVSLRAKLSGGLGQLRKISGGVALFKNPLFSKWSRNIGYSLLILIALLLPRVIGPRWNYVFGTVGIYILLALGLNIVVGLAGLLDLGYVAFYAIGGYTVALLTAPQPHHLQWSFWIALPIGVLLAGLAGVLLGLPVLRLRGDYLAIVTLGFGEIIRILSKSEALTPLTAGPKGVLSVGGPTLFGKPFTSDIDYMVIIILAVLLIIFITHRLQNSHVGRAWIAMREDETVAQAMGISTYRYKLLAFGIGAVFAGLGGGIFTSRNQFTGPEDYTLMVSINVLCAVIVGGMGSIPGVFAGAFALKGLPEILRGLENYWLLAFGALLVMMMILRPEGIIPSARRRLEMHREEPKPETENTSPSVNSSA